jgi:hypothetical protein
MLSPDRNYPPGDFADLLSKEFSGLRIAPPDDGAAFDDIWKVSHCRTCTFTDIEVTAGRQRENALDLNRESSFNAFKDLTLDAGDQGAILIKGGSSFNRFQDVLIRKVGGHTDIMIGGYSGQSKEKSAGNLFDSVRREDGQPVRYAYTFTRASRPIFKNSNVRFQFWWSLVRTVAMEFKYLTA